MNISMPPAPACTLDNKGLVAPNELLYRLLLSLFGSGEHFRRWIALGICDDAILAEFPERPVSAAAALFSGIEVLSRRGILDTEFFVRLTREFPQRRDDIARVAVAWGAPMFTKVTPEPLRMASRRVWMGIIVVPSSMSLGLVISAVALRSSAPRDADPVIVEPQLVSEKPPEHPPFLDSRAPEESRRVEVVERPPRPASTRTRKSKTPKPQEPVEVSPTKGCTISRTLVTEMNALGSELLATPAIVERFTVTVHGETRVTQVSPRPPSWQSARSLLYLRLVALDLEDVPGCAGIPIDVAFSTQRTTMDPRPR